MGTEGLTDMGWGLAALEGLWRASWQGALWAAVVWALTRALPRMPSALRAGLWWLVSLKFILSLGWLGPVSLPLLPAPASAPATPVEPAGAAPVRGGAAGIARAPAPSGAEPPWRQVAVAALLVAWGLGIGWRARDHLRAWGAVRRLRLRALPLRHPDIEEALGELASAAGLRRAPRLLISEEAKSPLATGLLSPVVVLPARALQRLDADALRMALAHELAHFQRRDLWLGWVPALAETLLFFHPLVRKVAREYALAREEACDAEALRLTGAEPGDYGQLLLAFGVARTHGTAAALGASAHLHALHRRLIMLEHVDVSSPRGRAPLRAALLVLGIAVLVPFQVVAREPAAPKAAASPAPAQVAAVPPIPAVAPAPPAPPTPAVAPAPPPAPVRPMLALASRAEDEDEDGLESFVLVSGSQVTMAGSTDELRLARALRSEGKDLLYVRREDKAYVIRDAKTLEQVRAAFEPQVKLGRQQAELGKEQAALGMKQAELGKEQAALGQRHAQLGLRQAELSLQVARASMQGNEAERERLEKELEKSREALEKEQEALSEQQEKLGEQQEKLGEQQEKLGERQEELGEQQEGLAHEARRKAGAIIDEALRKGLAEQVKP